MVSYNGLTKAEVLCALYNNAKCQGYGVLHFRSGDLNIEEAEHLISLATYYDYLYGRVLKIDLSGDEAFEEWLYDRDNGEGAAQRAIDDYIATKSNTL